MHYAIGKIVNTHGVKGEIKVLSDTDFDRFKTGNKIIVNQNELTIKSVRLQNKYLLVLLEGYNSLNDVMHLKGQVIYSSEKPLIVEKDTFYLPDLIGLSVITDKGCLVGVVKGIMDVPQGHILSIESEQQKKILIPFVNEFIKEITDDKIIITPIEGLL